MTSIDTAPPAAKSGWGAPAFAIVAGWSSVPLLFLSPMSALFSLALVSAALFVAFVVVVGQYSLFQKLAAVCGALGGVGSVLLLVLPFVLQS